MKRRKLLSTIFALALATVIALFAVGCTTNIFDEESSVAEYSKAYMTASTNFEKMLDYNEIEVSTVSSVSEINLENEITLTYKENEADEQTVTKEHVNVTTGSKTSTSYITKNNGEVFLIVVEKTVSYGTSYSVENQLLVEKKTELIKDETYEFGVAVNNNQTLYYMRKEASIAENKSAPVVTKEYKLYADRDAYVAQICSVGENLFDVFVKEFDGVYATGGSIEVMGLVSLENAIDVAVTKRGTEYSMVLLGVNGSTGLIVAKTTYRLTDSGYEGFKMENEAMNDTLKATVKLEVSYAKGAERYKTYLDPTENFTENPSLTVDDIGVNL